MTAQEPTSNPRSRGVITRLQCINNDWESFCWKAKQQQNKSSEAEVGGLTVLMRIQVKPTETKLKVMNDL